MLSYCFQYIIYQDIHIVYTYLTGKINMLNLNNKLITKILISTGQNYLLLLLCMLPASVCKLLNA